jgi:DNA invertase Pin-like site-specific DNA recombinase
LFAGNSPVQNWHYRRLAEGSVRTTDIEAGKIDVVVIYKIDRLTRSLADFSKMVEVFERYGVSFVSVTQQFNTTTSMGRLMLNILLSFAQFEREVTGERIRDKIAASKAKGMWMGGVPPLGYDVENRRLVPNAGGQADPAHLPALRRTRLQHRPVQ